MRINNGIIIAVAALLSVTATANASVTTGGSSSGATGLFTQGIETSDTGATTTYKVATNSFTDVSDGSTLKYVLLTQTSAKANDTSVSYDGATYTLDGVAVTDDLALAVVNGVSIFADNTTIFVDSGTYRDPAPSAYTRFSKTNFSVVGLDSVNKPVFTKAARPNDDPIVQARNTVERYIFVNPNVYLQNLIFDNEGRDMYPVGTNLGTPKFSKSRGEAAFFISGGNDGSATDGFVMRDCVIRNVGKENTDPMYPASDSNKNTGMNFYRNKGQVNIEGVRFENIKTSLGYGVVNLHEAAGIFLKDLSIDLEAAGEYVYPVKVEHNPTTVATSPVPPATVNAVLSNSLSVTPENRTFVYIQDYNYHQISVPSAFRYAAVLQRNGNSGRPAAMVLPKFPEISVIVEPFAVLDLQDKTWIVREGSTANIEQQLATIKAVHDAAGTNQPGLKIKLVADGDLDSFTIPDFGDETVEITVVSSLEATLPSDVLVPLAANATITSSNNTATKLKLSNIDFDKNAKLTLQRVTTGVKAGDVTPADPWNLAGYPKYADYLKVSDPLIPGTTKDTFRNCKFTSLFAEIKFDESSLKSLTVGETKSAIAGLKGTDTDSTSGTGLTGQGTADDKTVHYFSSDPTIVKVDLNTGEVTGLKPGTVKIIAKAMDGNNGGEIEKPWVEFALEVVPKTYSAGGLVFSDTNGNGVRDSGEPGVTDISVALSGPGADGVLGTQDDEKQTVKTDSDGGYSFTGVIPGSYRVSVVAPAGQEATPKFVDKTLVDQALTGLDFGLMTSLTPSGSPTPTTTESGSPTASATTTASVSPTASATTTASVSPTASATVSPSATASASVTTSASPSMSVSVSPSATGSASVSPSPSPTATESGSPTASATASVSPSVTTSPSVTPSPSVSPSVWVPDVKRVWGPNAWDTAVELSKSGGFVAGGVVYVATSAVFNDALAAVPAAYLAGAPILLTVPGGVPGSTLGELARLAPKRVVIQGGFVAVSKKEEAQIRGVVPGAEVVRNRGFDDRDTAVLTAGAFVSAGTVFVANNVAFADALAAGPVAANFGGPVFLTLPDGLVKPSIIAKAKGLGAKRVVLAGGVFALSESVADQFRAAGFVVDRVRGASSVDTSLALSRMVSPSPDWVYLANNVAYFDALSAGPVAARNRGVILLTNARCLQSDVYGFMADKRVGHIRIAGGKYAMAKPDFENLKICQP